MSNIGFSIPTSRERLKYIKGGSEYKYVKVFENRKKEKVYVAGRVNSIVFKTEREDALFIDKKLIAEGKEPVNILKRR